MVHQAIAVTAPVLLSDLDPEEYLGINSWSGHEFKLPARAPQRPHGLFFRRKRD